MSSGKPKMIYCIDVFVLCEESYEGFLLHIIQTAKPQETRHQSWVLKAEELHHGRSRWGGKSLERSPLERGMMGTWGHVHRADGNITVTPQKKHLLRYTVFCHKKNCAVVKHHTTDVHPLWWALLDSLHTTSFPYYVQ